jgi:Mlc titration factor MtfA (ptsG expression regulator)
MEIVVPILVLFIGISFIWFVITGIIVILTGKDISIGDLPGLILKRRAFDNSRDEYLNILISKFNYYKKLPDDLRPRFLRRVSNFITTREFVGNNGIVVTTEHKVLISDSAVQLTFGLDKYLLEHFSRVIVYPKEYFSTKGRTYHKGELNIQ